MQVVGKSIIKSQENVLLSPSSNQQQQHTFSILTDCQKCLEKYQDPVTLSCGFTLCHRCIPEKSPYKCMSFTCLRLHEEDECFDSKRINIVLKDILNNTTSASQIQQLLQCSVCLQPFHDPITTQCGHTFCKECLIRVMTDLNNRVCPICRFELSRIGKTCQTIAHWVQFIYQKPTATTALISEYIPIIKLNALITFPTQSYLFHINHHNNQSLFKQMIQSPFQHHYALCLFYSKEDEHYYDYGIIVKINHVEHSSDIQHSVIQAYGLFRLRIHQLLRDERDTNTFISYVTRLDDMNTTDAINRSLSAPTSYMQIAPSHRKISHTKSTQHTVPMSMARPCGIKLSYSAPNVQVTRFHYRRTWTNVMQFTKHYMTPPNTQPLLLPPAQPTIYDSVDDFKLKLELNARVQNYLLQQKNPDLLIKYECYNEQGVEYIWWLCTILPFRQNDKIYLFSLLSLRDRILTLIHYMDTKLK